MVSHSFRRKLTSTYSRDQDRFTSWHEIKFCDTLFSPKDQNWEKWWCPCAHWEIIENKTYLHNKESTFHINSNSFERIWIRLHLCRILLWNSQMFQLLKHISSFFGIHAEELICHGNNLNFWRAWCCDLQMKTIFFLEKWFTRIPICSNWFHCVIIPRADQIQPHLKEPTRPKGKRSFSEVIFL